MKTIKEIFDTAAQKLVKITDKQQLVVAVHDGTFHADDILCAAMLRYIYGANVQVIRSRNQYVLGTAHFILDVGGKDEVKEHQVWFDHHSKEKETYDNGIMMAACGKLARFLLADIDQYYYNFLKENLLYMVEAEDNGQNAADFNLPNNPFSFVHCFNLQDFEGYSIMSQQEKAFNDASMLATKVFDRINSRYVQLCKDMDVFEESLKSYDNNGYLFLNTHINMSLVLEYNEKHEKPIVLISFYDKGKKDYKLQVVPVKDGSFDSYIKMPKAWRGLRDSELDKVTGLTGSVFVHPAGFLGGWKEEEQVKKAAQMTLEANETM